MRLARRRLTWRMVASVVGFGVVYAALLVLYGVAGTTTRASVESSAPESVDVSLRVVAINPSAQRVSLAVDIAPPDMYFADDNLTLNRDLTLVIDPSSGSRQLNYRQGQTPSASQVELVTGGDIRTWPIDQYETALVVGVYEGSGDDTQLLPISVYVDGGIQGWRLTASVFGPIEGLGPPLQTMRIELHRSGDTLVLAVILLAVLAAMPIITLFVAIPTFLGRRAVQPTFMSWMAAMLFATIPIRNFLPGFPPPGSWIDAILVLWVIVGLIVSLALYAAAWWRQFGAP